MKTRLASALLSLALVPACVSALAASDEFTLTIKNHTFEPKELKLPAGKKIKLLVVNQDATPAEFESKPLSREKVIPGKSTGIINIGPLKLRLQKLGIIESDIELLENEIDAMEDSLPQMTHFLLPGGHTTVSYCHIARCVCRRAERLAVHLSHNEPVADITIKYLNRLSDYLFVLARKLSQDLNAHEVKWIPRK